MKESPSKIIQQKAAVADDPHAAMTTYENDEDLAHLIALMERWAADIRIDEDLGHTTSAMMTRGWQHGLLQAVRTLRPEWVAELEQHRFTREK